jgi:hypothetical protein
MKRLLLFFFLVLISTAVFSQTDILSENAIELPSITTIVNAQTITIVPESIPGFSSVAEPVAETPEPEIDSPEEIIVEVEPEIIEEIQPQESLSYAVSFVMRMSHPGIISTYTKFDSMQSFIPFYAGLKQDSVFGRNARTVLSPYGGMHYDWEYVSIGFDVFYAGQISGVFEKYDNRGQIDFSLSAHFLEWQLNGKFGFAFTNDGVLYPFNLSVFYLKNNFVFIASGGLETRYGNLLDLLRNNPEKKTQTQIVLGNEISEESYWYFRTMLDYRYTESVRIGLYVEYMNTAFNHGFYVFDYLGTNNICKKSMWLLNTGANFVYSIKRFDFSIKPLIYWRSAAWCYNYVDIDCNFRFEINDNWTLYWSLDDLKEVLTASGGGFSLGAKYKF